ncbi:MAG: PAS domain S-box protein [Thermomicrobiales bacterium]
MNGHPDYSMVENPDQTFHPKDLGFGSLFGAVQDAVIVAEMTSQRIVLWNSGAERVFGYSAEEALKMPIEVLIPKHLKERHGSGFASYAKTGQGLLVDASKLLELEAVHKSGDALFVELMLSSLNIADGRYVIAIVRDITDRKRSEIEHHALLASAQDYARRMAQLTTLKADFTAMVVHELGNPLAAIRSLVDLLSREEIPTSYPHHILTAIRSEAILLQRIVEDVHITADFERDDFAVHPDRRPLPHCLARRQPRSRTGSPAMSSGWSLVPSRGCWLIPS